jgi:5-methylcytosine-specific restriction endonuclease McrA
MLENQDGKCAECGEEKDLDQVQGHHIMRHADGGKTNEANGAAVCKDCHIKLHQ